MRYLIIVAAILAAWLPVTAQPAESKRADDADAQWDAINSGGPRPQRQAKESTFAWFMRGVELSDIRRRELGEKFWKEHPDDPRRYRWLMMTVHLPPHYARDVSAWVENETRIKPGSYAVDTSALERWERQYSAMRAQFWAAQSVTDEERRYFWYGELIQRMRRMEENPDAASQKAFAALEPELLAFIRTYREPYSDADKHTFMYAMYEPLYQAFDTAIKLKVSAEAQAGFVAQLKASGNRHAIEMAQAHSQWQSRRQEAEQDTSAKGRWAMDPRQRRSSFVSIDTPEGSFIGRYHRMIADRKYREIGLKLWDAVPDYEQRMNWLYTTLVSAASDLYAADFVAGLTQGAAGLRDEVRIDMATEQEWLQVLARLQSDLAADPQSTAQRVRGLRNAAFTENLHRVAREWRQRQDRKGVDAMLEQIKGASRDNDLSAGLHAREVFREAARYGLAEQDLRSLIDALLKATNEETQEFARSQQRLLDQRYTPLELKASTLAGQPFDLQSLRGKLVLVDFWATTCSAGIEAMPRIKSAYDKYRQHGFEVVSVCLDGAKQRELVEHAGQQMGLTWATLAADEIAQDIMKRYGYQGVPQYMLLDRTGKMIAGTTEVRMGYDLEALLDKTLAAEKSASTGLDAKSVLGQKAPDLGIERWVGTEPDRKGKFVLVDLWSTACEPCRKRVPKLNDWQRKFSDRLVVVGLTHETEPVLRRFDAVARRSGIPPMEYSIAIDTRQTLLKDLAVTGIPHVLLIDPDGIVRWQGYPLQSGRELTEAVVLDLIGGNKTASSQEIE